MSRKSQVYIRTRTQRVLRKDWGFCGNGTRFQQSNRKGCQRSSVGSNEKMTQRGKKKTQSIKEKKIRKQCLKCLNSRPEGSSQETA